LALPPPRTISFVILLLVVVQSAAAEARAPFLLELSLLLALPLLLEAAFLEW